MHKLCDLPFEGCKKKKNGYQHVLLFAQFVKKILSVQNYELTVWLDGKTKVDIVYLCFTMVFSEMSGLHCSQWSTGLGNGRYCCLTIYRTTPHFDALKIYSCGKHCEKRRN